MNDKEISIELLKLYPQYEGKYTFLQFLNLFQEVRVLISNKRKCARRLIKTKPENQFDSHHVFIDSLTWARK